MYISCGGNGTTMEPETGGYIPNNPLFGLPLDSPQVKYHYIKKPRFVNFLRDVFGKIYQF